MDKYRRTNKTVSMIHYHFVFCPRYRRKIFNIPGVEDRFKELVKQICEEKDIEILAMECHIDHCHLFLSSPPMYSPSDIMKFIKGTTSKALKQEFEPLSVKTNYIWTRNFFVSTAGDVSSETIRKYVEAQKTRS